MLKCEMRHDCAEPVTYIDEKGYIYCADHGQSRQCRRRKLRPYELNRLNRGEQVVRY